MHTTAERLEFAPPVTPGVVRAFMLALLAHGLLVAALTWGVHWQRDAPIVSFDAELWASVPVAAAPRLQEPMPKPTQKLTPEPLPPEEPQAVAKPAPLPPPAAEPPKVDIALEQEKLRLLKQKQLEQQKLEEQRKLDEKRKLEEQRKQARLQQEKLKEEQRKADQLKQAQAEKNRLAQEKKLAEQQARQLEAQRAEHLQRITGLAGATGAPGASGAALKSAGPSASYAGRIRARIKPNIVFIEDIAGNPTAEVEVHAAPDGKILASKLTKSSGVSAWDEAVLRAIAKTEVLPRDTDGRVPSPLVISFRPKD